MAAAATTSSILASTDLGGMDEALRLAELLRAVEAVCAMNSTNIATAHGHYTRVASEIRTGPMPRGEKVTSFHSVRVSPLSLPRLGTILRGNFDISFDWMRAAVVLLVRYCETTGFRTTLHAMHRQLASCIVLVMKTHCDFFFSNEGAGRACGLCLEEVNRLESALCEGLRWRLLVEADEVADQAALLQRIRCLAAPSLDDEAVITVAPPPCFTSPSPRLRGGLARSCDDGDHLGAHHTLRASSAENDGACGSSRPRSAFGSSLHSERSSPTLSIGSCDHDDGLAA